MSIYDTVTIVIAACLNGWFINSLLRLEAEGNRWPLVRRYLLTTFWFVLLFISVIWHSFGCSYFWSELTDDFGIASATGAMLAYRVEMRKRFHIPTRRRGVN